MRSTHIAFCIPNMMIGGVETVFSTILAEMVAHHEIQISILTHAHIRNNVFNSFLKQHPEIKIYTVYPLCNWFEDMKPNCHGALNTFRKIIFSIYKKYRRVYFRIMHNFRDVDVFIDYKNIEFFKELKFWHKPKIAFIHTSLQYCEQYNLFKRFNQYDKLVVLTDECANEMMAKFPQHANKFTRIYNALNVNQIRQDSEKTSHPDGKYFTHVSRLVSGKDIKTLLDAFDLFYQNHPDVKLYIIGDGEKSGEYKQYAKNLECNKNVIFTGEMQNPYSYIRGAIANILSSTNEGFGVTLVESQILDTPIISSKYKYGALEILENGKSGLLFEIGNSADLAEKMEKIVTDKNLSKKLIKHAGDRIHRFTPENIVLQIINLINQTKDVDK